MIETLTKMIFEIGNIYIIVITILSFSLYGLSQFVRKNSKFNERIINLINENHDNTQTTIMQIQTTLNTYDKEITTLYNNVQSKVKDIDHCRDKSDEKIIEILENIKEVKKEVTDLKYKVELIIIQNNQSGKLYKGL